MFAYLIQQRIEEPSFQLVFFDQAVRIMNELGLNSLTSDKRYQLSLSSPSDKHILTLNEKDIDTLLCDLVICFNMATSTFSPSRKPLTLTDIINKRKQQNIKSLNNIDSNGVDNGSKKIFENRTEINSIEIGTDLQLDDIWKGPLILPGPTKTEQFEKIIEDTLPDLSDPGIDDLEFERPSSVRFSYSTGWPDLNISKLTTRQNLYQKSYEILQNIRIKSIEKVEFRHFFLFFLFSYNLFIYFLLFKHKFFRLIQDINILLDHPYIELVINQVDHCYVQFK